MAKLITIFITILIVVLVTLVGAACGAGHYTPVGEERDVLTRSQLLGVNAINIYDGIQKLRPSWLTSRGPVSMTDDTPAVVSVFMSGNQIGDSNVLRDMRVEDIDSVRYFDAGVASARFGMGHPRGVIEVLPRGTDR